MQPYRFTIQETDDPREDSYPRELRLTIRDGKIINADTGEVLDG